VILPALTAIVDADVAAVHGWTVPDAARACLNGGARLLQVIRQPFGLGGDQKPCAAPACSSSGVVASKGITRRRSTQLS